jgi:hypothetical protein
MTDKNKNLVLTFNRSGEDEYIGAFLSGRRETDPAGLANSILIKEGAGNYIVVGGGRNRWGDYSGIGLDPRDQQTIWTHTEFASAKNRWGTWVGEIKVGPLPGKILTTNRSSVNFGTKNIGVSSDTAVVQIFNDGLDPLTLHKFTINGQHFLIVNPPSSAITIPSRESFDMKIYFKPGAGGKQFDTVSISSDDPVHPVTQIFLSGNGFRIAPSQLGVMYASSGLIDGGNLYQVNTSFGTAKKIASLGIPQSVSLRVHPRSKELIGLVPSSTAGSSTFFRISSEGDNAESLVTIKLTNIKGFDFISDSLVLIGNISGSLFIVNIFTGSVKSCSSVGFAVGGISVNPITKKIWASVRSLAINPDALYIISLTDTLATAVFVGKTGFNVLTQDILFDKNGNLFGLIGSGSFFNELIKIDTSTAQGLLIGSLGVSNILAIALNPDAVSSIEGQQYSPVVQYSLSQNYPNPFNPITSIRFELPEPSYVQLKVFDNLGREVQTLADGNRLAGHHIEYFDASGLSSGTYYYRLVSSKFTAVKRMSYIK